MDRNECRLCTEDELKEKGISYEQEEWELKAVLSVTQKNGRNLRRPDLSLMFIGDWLSPFAHKSLQAWNANKRMRLRLGCPHQNDIYLFTNVNTLRLLTNWRYPFSFTVGDFERTSCTRLQTLMDSCENGFIPSTHTALFVWTAHFCSIIF